MSQFNYVGATATLSPERDAEPDLTSMQAVIQRAEGILQDAAQIATSLEATIDRLIGPAPTIAASAGKASPTTEGLFSTLFQTLNHIDVTMERLANAADRIRTIG